jgi:hypothetical protein
MAGAIPCAEPLRLLHSQAQNRVNLWITCDTSVILRRMLLFRYTSAEVVDNSVMEIGVIHRVNGLLCPVMELKSD